MHIYFTTLRKLCSICSFCHQSSTSNTNTPVKRKRPGLFKRWWLRWGIGISAAILVATATIAFTPGIVSADVPNHVIYDETLDWDNWSWRTTVNPNVSVQYHAGKAMAVTFNSAWAGFSLHHPGFDTSNYSTLDFMIHPTDTSILNAEVSLYNSSDKFIKGVNLQSYAGYMVDGWYQVSIPLADLNGTNRTITRVQIQSNTNTRQSLFHIDNIQFVGNVEVPVQLGSYKPPESSWEVDQAIRVAVTKYNLPRWFYYSIIHRESSFDPDSVGYYGEQGLTQINTPAYEGMYYPMWLDTPNNNHREYGWDMGFNKYGRWINMTDVSWADNTFDPEQNLDRFSTGYAVKAFYLFKDWYGLSDAEALRAVAYHWNKGLFKAYDPNNWDYLGTYDEYVNRYRWTVEDQDGQWDGKPQIP